jgi:acetylornithine deacetylase
LIAKIPPGESLDDVRRGMEAAARGAVSDARVTLTFSYPAGRDHPIGGRPFELLPEGGWADRLAGAIAAVRPDRGQIDAAPYWSEMPILSALGIPGVYFAPGDITVCHTSREHVILQDYNAAIIALASFLAAPDSAP